MKNTTLAILFFSASSARADIPPIMKSPNGSSVAPAAIECDGTGTLEIDGSTWLIDCNNNSVSAGGASTFVGSATLKAVSRIEDTMTLASDARGDISWNANEVTLDGNAGYGLSLGANGQNAALYVNTNATAVIGSTTYKSTWAADGSWDWQVGANDKGFKLNNGNTSSVLMRCIRDGSADSVVCQFYDTNGVKIQLDAAGSSYFNSGNVGIGTASPLAGLHVSTNSSFTEPATFVSSVTLKAVSRIEDTMTLASDARGDITWNATEVLLDGNAGYGISLAGNGQGAAVQVGTDGSVSLSSGVNQSTISNTGAWTMSVNQNDNGIILLNGGTGNNLFKAIRDAGTDTSVLQLFDTNTIKVNIDASGVSYFNGGNVGIGVSPTLGILHIDKGTGVGQITADGSTGGCIMLRDTDDAGWTECDALDGVLSCSIDADGACD